MPTPILILNSLAVFMDLRFLIDWISRFSCLCWSHNALSCLGDLLKGIFRQKNTLHWGAAWYWHFVDVVWLGLYVLVYWT